MRSPPIREDDNDVSIDVSFFSIPGCDFDCLLPFPSLRQIDTTQRNLIAIDRIATTKLQRSVQHHLSITSSPETLLNDITKMDPPECSGHSHDHHDHGDDLGLSLRPQVDLPAVRCLNEELPNSGRAVIKLHEERLSTEPALKSQEDDPELLLFIPFTEAVILQSISIRSVAGEGVEGVAPPRRIKLFVDRDDLDFETARDMEPQMQLELLPPQHFVEGTIDYPLRPAGRFQGISSLAIYVADNYGGDDDLSTIITYVGLKGKGTHQKRMAVETVYEVKPMPEKTKAENFTAMARESC